MKILYFSLSVTAFRCREYNGSGHFWGLKNIKKGDNMAKILVYNTSTGNMETFWRNENESMPYVWNNTMRVREFRGSSNSPTLWTTRQAMESFLAPGQKYVEKVNISENPDIATPAEVSDLLRQQLPKVILAAWENRKILPVCVSSFVMKRMISFCSVMPMCFG